MSKMFFISNIASIVCIIAAFILCFCDLYGWGWFLAAGVATATSYERKEEQKRKTLKDAVGEFKSRDQPHANLTVFVADPSGTPVRSEWSVFNAAHPVFQANTGCPHFVAQ